MDVSTLGELLKLPNLEKETIALINAKMREILNDATTRYEAEYSMMKDPSIVDEWLNGKPKGGE